MPVGSFAPNAFGLYDVHGNVWEWTQDCWSGRYMTARFGDGRAWERGECGHRVVRGGSWYNEPRRLRSAYRSRRGTSLRHYDLGFRLTRTLTP